MKKILIFLILLISFCACTQKSEADKFVDALLEQMTLREKLGQMTQVVPKTGEITGPEGEPMDIEALLKAGEVGSMLGVKKPEDIEKYLRHKDAVIQKLYILTGLNRS